MTRFALPLLLGASLALLAPLAVAQSTPGCDLTPASGAGPFDYRSQRQMLHVVERRHFTTRVERLLSGESTKNPGPDIDYTLGKYPNHHRALLSLKRLGEKLKSDRDPLMPHSISCYFERALAFRGDDTLVRMIYAMHLNRLGGRKAAEAQLQRASQDAGDNGLTHHNIGMVYFDLGLHEAALASAHRALQLGVDLPQLRQRLTEAGRWQDPAPLPSAEAASAPPAAASAAASAASE